MSVRDTPSPHVRRVIIAKLIDSMNNESPRISAADGAAPLTVMLMVIRGASTVSKLGGPISWSGVLQLNCHHKMVAKKENRNMT